MATKSFHVSIPDYMQSFVEERIAEHFHKSPGSYVHELIRQDKIRSEKIKLTNRLLVGLASGEEKMKKGEWKEMQQEALSSIKSIE
jgi:Arc/MetJ-type ribon-helix-helix transcriptional regulator